MKNGAVFCALRFFLKMACAVVTVSALKSKASIGAIDCTAGKSTQVIDVVLNFSHEFAILARRRGDGSMLRVIELINSARAVCVHRHSYPVGIIFDPIRSLAQSAHRATRQVTEGDYQSDSEKVHCQRS